MRIFQWALLSLVGPWVLLQSGLAEPVAVLPTEYPVSAPFLNSRWSQRDGLPGGSILDLAQSPDGLLWVATRFGLRALDGVRFFVPDGLESLSDEPVHRVLFDGDGQIWLRGPGTLYCLKPQPDGGYQKEELPASDVVQDGKGWVWWQNGGVIRGRFGSLEAVLPPGPVLKGESLELLPAWCGAREGGVYLVDNRGNLWRGTLQGWVRIPGALPTDARVRRCEIFEDRKQRIWMSILTQSGEVLWVRRTSQEWRAVSLPRAATAPLARCFHETSHGELLVGTERGLLYQFSDTRTDPQLYRITPNPEPIQAIHEDMLGNWWVGAEESGLRLICRDSNRLLARAPPITATQPDGVGSVPVQAIDEREAFPIESIALDSGGRLWAAAGAHGLFVREGDRLRALPQAPGVLQGGTAIKALAPSPRGLVVGGDRLLMVIDDLGRPVSGHDHSAMLGGASVNSLAVDGTGGIWAGTDSGKLLKLPPGAMKPDVIPVGSPVFDLAVQTDRIWVVAGRQLRCWVLGQWEPLPQELELLQGPQSLFVDHQGRLTVVGSSEVVIRGGRKIVHLGPDQGVFPGVNSKVFQDLQSGLWLATDAGILELNSAWIDRAFASDRGYSQTTGTLEAVGRVIQYSIASEIQLTSKRNAAPWVLPSGEVALPSNKGVLLVRQDGWDVSEQLPAVQVGGMQTGWGETLNGTYPTNDVCIPEWFVSRVSLRRNLAAALQPPLVRYSISDDNHSWTYVGVVDSFRIIQPSDKQFSLRIQNKLPGGAWGAVRTTRVEVDRSPSIPTPWRLGVLSLFLVLGGLVVWQSYRSSRHRRRVHIRALEGIQSDRVRIARNLHDDLGNRLSEIQLLAEQLTFSQGSPRRGDPTIDRIHARSVEATEVLDNLVWLLRDVSEPSIDLGRHIERLARDYLSVCSVGLEFQILAGQDVEIGGWVRQLLIAATQELTRNAVRHGRATQVGIELRVSADWVCYQVQDNGVGFSVKSALASGRGLSSLVSRVGDVGGSVSVVSQPGHSVIVIQVPRAVR
jgi:ligand-binding sensor domain-containing protein